LTDHNSDKSETDFTDYEQDEGNPEEVSPQEKDRAEEYLASLQRAQADLSNYIKRAEREKLEIIEYANRSLILDLLPILDDFERALGSIPAKLARSSWTEGVKLIYNKIKSILEIQGVTRIEAVGKDFDPYLHEAVAQAEGEEGIILEEVHGGYMFKNKLLRPSSVIVGKGQLEESNDKEQIGEDNKES
jgi:molecular chaperone GrpE